MNQRSLYFFLIFLLFVHNSYALRCNQSLVELGDSPGKVKRICGKPDKIKTIHQVNQHGRSEKIQWTYDFGPREFRYVLTFKQGKLVRIMTNGWGTE